MNAITSPTQGALEDAIRQSLGNNFCIQQTSPASAGDTNQTLRIEGTTATLFAKVGVLQNHAHFQAEALCLKELSTCSAFHVPAVLAQAQTDTHSFLIMEWLDLHPLRTQQEAERAGQALAQLHQIEHEHYGWSQDNFIGATPQANAWYNNWPLFFTQQRLKPQLELAAQKGYCGALQKDGQHILQAASALFLNYHPRPSLLHGDLWSGNIGALPDGRPALFDPACYYGDRETDIAMTELFGGFPLPFYAAYRQSWSLDEGFERRKNLYNLYHILNHLNLFGKGYLGQAERVARNLARELNSSFSS